MNLIASQFAPEPQPYALAAARTIDSTEPSVACVVVVVDSVVSVAGVVASVAASSAVASTISPVVVSIFNVSPTKIKSAFLILFEFAISM